MGSENGSADTQKNIPEDISYEKYPGRQGKPGSFSWFSTLFFGQGHRDNLDKLHCEKNVIDCVNTSPLVKLMLEALEAQGCPVKLERHISCEPCDTSVTGGYDNNLNQVVVCQNTAKKRGAVQGVLAHELVHMFDACRSKMDYNDIDHLACTEIRAANMLHCSFLGALMGGQATPFKIAKTHAECVKAKAVASVLSCKKVSKEEATAAVDRVFTRCYNDLEPIGRRLRRRSPDMDYAYRERYHYGYGV